jgi:hypothetical protein
LNTAAASWLEIAEGDAPILLIAPHGGRAGRAASAKLHPKVNDLETAAITRELARRLGASALINAGMDRNELDCNRLSQLTEHAPWLLELISRRVERIIARHRHVVVLLIHGWNIIEPRVDLGLGLRESAGRLRPPAGAHVSASDEFINGPVTELAARLRAASILPSFGMRYPGGDAQNLLQAFTPRHQKNSLEPLRRLAVMSATQAIDALQLEMSVALRLPGTLRAQNLDALSEVFSRRANGGARAAGTFTVVREVEKKIAKKLPAVSAASASPARVGVEFFDPSAGLGGMVSFDFGPGAAGGRIMVLFERTRVALFTGEGKARYANGRLSLGPLTFHVDAEKGELEFRGPAVLVDDGTAYLSVERALADGRLDAAMEVRASLQLDGESRVLDSLLRNLETTTATKARGDEALSADALSAAFHRAAFGRLRGSVVVGGLRRTIDASARIGASFSGLGPQKFVSRQMLWACFPAGSSQYALEVRSLKLDTSGEQRIARILQNGRWSDCDVTRIDLNARWIDSPPRTISANLSSAGRSLTLDGTPETFMTLSRPGPDGTRICTTLGFASYRFDGHEGAGMYEYSRRL